MEEGKVNESPAQVEETPTAETPNESTEGFSPTAFLDNSSKSTPTETPSETPSGETPAQPGEEGGDDFSWENTPSNEQPNDTPTEQPTETPSSETPTDDVPPVETPTETPTVDYAEMSKDYGFEGVTNKEEFDARIKQLSDDNKVYKELAESSLTNDTIKKLERYTRLSAEDLVREDLKLSGVTEDNLETAIRRLKDDGTLNVEADKIRHNVNLAIDGERNKIVQNRKDQDAKQLKDQEDSIRELKEHLDGAETMFGLQMSKDPDKLPEIRKNHHEYITSGSFLKEITGSNESIAEAAWLWRHRETLLKALTNKGTQGGRQEILEDLGNHDATGQKRIVIPDQEGFNPNKFNATATKK